MTSWIICKILDCFLLAHQNSYSDWISVDHQGSSQADDWSFISEQGTSTDNPLPQRTKVFVVYIEARSIAKGSLLGPLSPTCAEDARRQGRETFVLRRLRYTLWQQKKALRVQGSSSSVVNNTVEIPSLS